MPTDRIFNFSAGPAVLPEPVLRKAQEAIWNVAGSGIGIMEHSHRGKVFDKIIAEAEANCRALAGIPDDLVRLFSKRTDQIDQAVQELAADGRERTARLVKWAVHATRKPKEHETADTR